MTIDHHWSSLAIISSYKVLCGVAAFTEILETTLREKNVAIEVIPLDVPLLKRKDTLGIKAGNNHIENICANLKKFEHVNIQLEYSLFGAKPNTVWSRLKNILTSHSSVSITFHALYLLNPEKKYNFLKRFIYKIIGKKDQLKELELQLLRFLVDHEIQIRVFSQEAKSMILKLFPKAWVVVHPLKLLTNQQIQIAKSGGDNNSKEYIKKIKHHFSSSPQSVVLGAFGFIFGHKGYLDILNALLYLPDYYKLIIVGDCHPQQLNNSYYIRLKEFVKENGLDSKVLFLGAVEDQSMADLMAFVDIVLIPYELSKSPIASGIISIALDVAKKVISTPTRALLELLNLIPYKNIQVLEDPKNSAIFAKIIQNTAHSEEYIGCHLFNYSIDTQAKLYANAYEKNIYNKKN